MSLAAEAAAAFYDAHVDGKIRDFVDGNRRVDAAWRTIDRWMPPAPARALEIGCGLGAMSWRLARKWPDAVVFGTDTSEQSIACGRRLFHEPKLSFGVASVDSIEAGEGWDVIVLIDVYEHIPEKNRESFNRHLRRLLRRNGRIVLTFPTARYQRWLRTAMPEKLQPVDEDVDIAAITALADACSIDVLMFEVVSVWNGGDYAHAVLGTSHLEELVPAPPVEPPPFSDRLAGKWPGLFRPSGEWPSRPVRLSMIESSFGPDGYRRA
jgi:trans-aconitate methyltransferase